VLGPDFLQGIDNVGPDPEADIFKGLAISCSSGAGIEFGHWHSVHGVHIFLGEKSSDSSDSSRDFKSFIWAQWYLPGAWCVYVD
jgi:hypothetical protein